MKIAIIGSGISGLYAAYRLSPQHEVTLFEALDAPGGHVNTVPVEVQGQVYHIDTGFIVYNERTYPHFVQLLAELGVATQPTSMSFSVRCDRSGLEYSGTSLRTLFAQTRNLVRPRFYCMLWDILRFNRLARKLANDPCPLSEDQTIEDFLRCHRFSESFANWYLLPMGAAIWSCPQAVIRQFPVGFLLRFFSNHGLLEITNRPVWRVIQGGSRTYVDRLLERCGPRLQLRLKTSVQSVRRTPNHVLLTTNGHGTEYFDHVIFACHSDQALRLLTDPSPSETEILSGFEYAENVAILHTDRRLLPKSRLAWSSWNFYIPATPDFRPKVTYCMNILQNLRSSEIFNVSLNCEDLIDSRKILRRFRYSHPIFNGRTRSLQSRHSELINVCRTSFCGAYWRNGFHEDGLVSARKVCQQLETAHGLELAPTHPLSNHA